MSSYTRKWALIYFLDLNKHFGLHKCSQSCLRALLCSLLFSLYWLHGRENGYIPWHCSASAIVLCPGRVEMPWKSRSYGWMAQKSGEVMLLQTCLAVTYCCSHHVLSLWWPNQNFPLQTQECICLWWLATASLTTSSLTVIALYFLWILWDALWGLHGLWTVLESHTFWLWQYFLKQSSSQAVTRAH